MSVIAAVLSGIFAGLSWIEEKKSRQHAEAREVPDLWLEKDKFVYGDYELAENETTGDGQPKNVPRMSAVLRNFSVKKKDSEKHFNRICAVFNSSDMDSSNNKIDHFTGFFGEVYFENRGEVTIRRIKFTNFTFKMNTKYKPPLEDFSLTPIGEIEVDIGRGSSFTMLIAYLYNNADSLSL